MAKITVKDVPPFDGEYEIDKNRLFNGDEWHLIKQVSGVRMGEFDEALEALDYDLLVAITAVNLCRHGKVTMKAALQAVEVLRGAELGSIKFDGEADAGPPAKPPATENEESAGTGDNSLSSSTVSNGHSERPLGIIPAAIGDPS